MHQWKVDFIMKIGMTSLTLKSYKIEDVIKYAKTAGLEGIEWGESENHMPLCDSKRAELIKKLSKDWDIEIFSYGSYCAMQNKECCDMTLETAIMLGAPIIRVWAGRVSPEDVSKEEYDNIISCTRYMANKAFKYNIKIGFEYHRGTLTQESASAVQLIKHIDMKNVGLYWQPFSNLTVEENFSSLKEVQPYLIGNLHIHNHNEKYGYQPLADINSDLRKFFGDIKDSSYNLLIEFVCNSCVENLMNDARLLRTILK